MIGVIIVTLVGALCIILGLLLWKKEMITLLHDYHYNKVSAQDKKAFCALSGKGLLCVGAGLLVTAIILALTESAWAFLAFATGLIVGITLLAIAGKKYNC